jgi:hypothetical protein
MPLGALWLLNAMYHVKDGGSTVVVQIPFAGTPGPTSRGGHAKETIAQAPPRSLASVRSIMTQIRRLTAEAQAFPWFRAQDI